MGARGVVQEETAADRLVRSPVTVPPLDPPAAGQASGGDASSQSKLASGLIDANHGSQTAPRAPALTFSLSYPGPAGRHTEVIEWQLGRTVGQYLAQRPGLKGIWLRHRSIDAATRRKIKLNHVPTVGQSIILLHGPGSR